MIMMQDIVSEIPLTHAVRDYIMLAILTLLGMVNVLDRYGLLPERRTGNGKPARSVGKMPVGALQAMIRSEVADVMKPVAKDLNNATLHLEKIITILEERRR